MKTLVTLAAILLFTITGWAQGPVRRADTLQQVLAIDPTKVAVGKLSYLVMGRTNVTDGELLLVDFDPTNNLAADNITIFTNVIASGRWVIRPVLASSPLTFQAGTNLSVVVTNNTVTYSYTGTPSLLIDGLPVTEFLDNGYVNFDNGGSGTQYSLYLGDDTISTNKINSTFYNWVLSLAGAGGGTTNGLGVNGTFRTDWNAINSAEIAYTLSAGTNWYASIVAGSIAANKLGTSGTGTSTNFLAGDYSYKQVTTNMIPGLNAILATIGSGGGGTNYTQFWYDLTNSVVSSNNITIAYDNTNKKLLISAATGGTNSGTTVTVDGGADNVRLNLADSTGIGASLSGTNASFALVDRDFGSVTVSGSGTTITYDNNSISSNHITAGQVSQDKLGTSGTGTATNFLAGDYSYKQVTTNMIPGLNAILATIGTGGGSGTGSVVTANGGSDMSRANITTNGFGLLVTQSGTNILLSTTNNYPAGYYAGGFLPLFAGVSNALTGDLSMDQSSDVRLFMSETSRMLTDGYEVMGLRAYNGKLALHSFATNDLSAAEEFMVIDPSDLVGPTDIITFPNSGFNNKVVFEADVELNGNVIAGTQTLGTSNTTVATTAFVLQNAGGDSGSDTNWNGNPIASGTITNLTTAKINGNQYYNIENGDFWSDGFVSSSGALIFGYPFSGTAISGGSSASNIGLTNNPGVSTINAAAGANSGYVWYTSTSIFDISGRGPEFTGIVAFPATNNVVSRNGFGDTITATEISDGAYVKQEYGFLRGVVFNNGSATYTTSSNQISPSSTAFYRVITRCHADGSGATFWVLSPLGPGTYITNWTDTVTATLPSGTSRLTGAIIAAFDTTGSAGKELLRVDAMGGKFTQPLIR